MADNPQNNDLQTFVNDVERDLLFHILNNMRHRKLTVAEASALAKEFLSTLPVHDKHQLLNTLNELSKTHPEAQAVYVKYAGPILEQERKEKVAKMAEHIKAGNIEEALQVAKGNDPKTSEGGEK